MAKRNWNNWRTFWVAMIVLFLAVELPAVFNREDDDTFSEFMWDFVVINPIGWLATAVLLGWLIKHFLFEKDRN